MYSFLSMLALVVLWAFWRALRGHGVASWIALVVFSAMAYLTHYFALYLPLIEFAFLLMMFRRYHDALVRWTLAQGLAALLFVGWLAWLYPVGGGTFGISWIPTPRLDDLLRTLWSFGMAYDGRVNGLVGVVVLTWCGLLLIGIWHRNNSRQAQGLLALALALPPLGTFLLSMRRPTYVDRFFIGSLPAFLLLASLGLCRLPRRVRWTIGLALVGINLWGIFCFQADPFFVKEAWRDAAAYIQAYERAGDVLVLRYFQYVVPFRYYYHGTLEPETVTLNQQTKLLEELAAGHERLWFVLRSGHTDAHHLAWSRPLDPAQDEQTLQVRNWISLHSPAEMLVLSGIVVMRFDLRDRVEIP